MSSPYSVRTPAILPAFHVCRLLKHLFLNRWYELFVDSLMGQHLSLCRKFSALDHLTILSLSKKLC